MLIACKALYSTILLGDFGKLHVQPKNIMSKCTFGTDLHDVRTEVIFRGEFLPTATFAVWFKTASNSEDVIADVQGLHKIIMAVNFINVCARTVTCLFM